MAAATSPERTVVSGQVGFVSVRETTYLGFVFRAMEIGFWPWSAPQEPVPQELAKIS
jgi:hypothetical protein